MALARSAAILGCLLLFAVLVLMGPLKPLFYGSVYLAKGGALKSAPVANTKSPSGIDKARDALSKRLASRRVDEEVPETEPHVLNDTSIADQPIRMASNSGEKDLAGEVPDRETNEHLELEQGDSVIPVESASSVELPSPMAEVASPNAAGSESATTLITTEPDTDKVDPSIPRLKTRRPTDPPTAFDSAKENPGEEENLPAREVELEEEVKADERQEQEAEERKDEPTPFVFFDGYKLTWEYIQVELPRSEPEWAEMQRDNPTLCLDRCTRSEGACVGFAHAEYPSKNRICMFYGPEVPPKEATCGHNVLSKMDCYSDKDPNFRLFVKEAFAKERKIELPPEPPTPPPGPLSPPPFHSSSKRKDFNLTAEYVQEVAVQNLVIVTWANFHYLDFALNWATHLKELGLTNVMIGAMDQEILEALVVRGHHAFSMNMNSLTTKDFGWGSPTFHKMGRQKITLCREFMMMGFSLLLSDVDTVWLRDPLPFIAQYPAADLLVSSDMLATTLGTGVEALETRDTSPANIGIMYFKPGDATLRFVTEWKKMIDERPDYWDQNAFNDLYKRGSPGTRSPKPDSKNLFQGYQGQITMGILSVSQWCSGHTFFVQQMHLQKKVEPYVVHATFQFAGTEGKRHRFREAKLWIDNPEYYDPPRGVVTYVNDVPADLLHRAATEYNGKLESSAAHFELVHHQLQQLRNALGVALALGRHLVLPKLMCGIDRVWFPHRGIFPGSQLKLPFQCPVDHVIEIQSFVTTRPAYAVLEHSFLENPRTPDSLKQSVKELTLGVDLTMNVTDVQIQTLLKGHENAKVLKFDSLVGQVFAGFEDKAKNEEFQMRLKRATGIWGTAMSRPGHVHYDFFADVAPWKDRHMRSRSKPWTLVGGEQAFPE